MPLFDYAMVTCNYTWSRLKCWVNNVLVTDIAATWTPRTTDWTKFAIWSNLSTDAPANFSRIGANQCYIWLDRNFTDLEIDDLFNNWVWLSYD